MHMHVFDQYTDPPRPSHFRGRLTHNVGHPYQQPPPWDHAPVQFVSPPLPKQLYTARPQARHFRDFPESREKEMHSNKSPRKSPYVRGSNPSIQSKNSNPSPHKNHSNATTMHTNKKHSNPPPGATPEKGKKPIVVTDAIQSGGRVEVRQEMSIKVKRKRQSDETNSSDSHKTEETKRAKISTQEAEKKEPSPSSSVIFIGDVEGGTEDPSPSVIIIGVEGGTEDPSPQPQPATGMFARLTSEVIEYDVDNAPSDQLTNIKLDYCDFLSRLVQRSIHHPRFIVFGSSLNGFSTRSSDLDIALLVEGQELFNNPLSRVFRCLRKHSSRISRCRLITAKVPIVSFWDLKYGIQIDISLNNHSGIRNTFLLRTYSRLDERVRSLVVVVKEWAKSNDVCNSKNGLLSSYALTLMVLFFLQHAVSPPMLPSLQRMYPEEYNAYHTIDQIKQVNIREICQSWHSENTMSVGQMLIGFFEFYAKLDFRDKLISVRTGCLHDRPSWEGGMGYKGYINIEEPYTLENAARSVYLLYRCKQIISEFKKKHRQLSNKQLPKTLDNVFSETV